MRLAAVGELLENCGATRLKLRFPTSLAVAAESAAQVAVDVPRRLSTRVAQQGGRTRKGGMVYLTMPGDTLTFPADPPEHDPVYGGVSVGITLEPSGRTIASCIEQPAPFLEIAVCGSRGFDQAFHLAE